MHSLCVCVWSIGASAVFHPDSLLLWKVVKSMGVKRLDAGFRF